MRDVDANVRRAVYAVVLNPDKAITNEEMIDVTHPRAMKIADRESIIRNGLGDREESVKAERDYEVIDPRARASRAKEEERERKGKSHGRHGGGRGYRAR